MRSTSTQPIDLVSWLRILAVASSILLVMEVHKAFRRRQVWPGSVPTKR